MCVPHCDTQQLGLPWLGRALAAAAQKACAGSLSKVHADSPFYRLCSASSCGRRCRSACPLCLPASNCRPCSQHACAPGRARWKLLSIIMIQAWPTPQQTKTSLARAQQSLSKQQVMGSALIGPHWRQTYAHRGSSEKCCSAPRPLAEPVTSKQHIHALSNTWLFNFVKTLEKSSSDSVVFVGNFLQPRGRPTSTLVQITVWIFPHGIQSKVTSNPSASFAGGFGAYVCCMWKC